MTEAFWVPFPPTANTMFAMQGHRRFPSDRYVAWRNDAALAIAQQKPSKVSGPVSISIALRCPYKRTWDLDNRVKPILDLLVGHGIIEDDSTEIVQEIVVTTGGQVGAEISINPKKNRRARPGGS